MQIASVAPGQTTYSDTSLLCSSTYYYRVRAYRSYDDGYTNYSTTANAATVACTSGWTHGTVQSVGGNNLENIQVCAVYDPGGPVVACDCTDGDGYYRISGISFETSFHVVAGQDNSACGGPENYIPQEFADMTVSSTSPVLLQGFTLQDLDVSLDEYLTLVNLYNSTGGAQWANNAGWLQDHTVCDWHGILCDDSTPRHVLQINLYENLLDGTLPDLSALTYLQVLDLDAAPWHPWIGAPDQLLRGSFPDLSALTNLTYLDLGWHQFTGDFPDLAPLTNLEHLSLHGVALSGPISDLSALTQLQVLDLSFMGISGDLPDLSALASLRVVGMDFNNLSGEIPDLSALTNLELLYLCHNQLTGPIPDLSAQASLQELCLFDNRLSGVIPDLLALVNLHGLTLNNNQLSGDIPASLATLPALADLDLGYNMLTISDPTLIAFLNTADPDWANTQTVPVSELAVHPLTPAEVELTWQPILYTGDGGYYEINISTNGVDWAVHAQTTGKSAYAYTADGLTPEVTYYFCIKTYTPAHDRQQNDLLSTCSQVVTYIPAWQFISEQTVHTAIDGHISGAKQIDFAIVDLTPGAFNMTIGLVDGTVGNVVIAVTDSGAGFVTLQIESVTVAGSPAPDEYTNVIYSELMPLISTSWNALFANQFGPDHDLQNMFVDDQGVFITLSGVAPVPLDPVNAPSGLIANAVTTQIDLAWNDNSGDETAFHIEQSTDGGATWIEIGAVGAGVTVYSDTTALCGQTTTYRVRAYDGNAFSTYSNVTTTRIVPDGSGEIAFASNRDGDYEIYTMNLDGSNLCQLTENSATELTPDWSPNGTQITFQSDIDGDVEIFKMNADGSNPVQLTHNTINDSDPDWSPDGTRIAYMSYLVGNPEVYVMDADGSNPVNLTNYMDSMGGEDGGADWSPDGLQIAFVSERYLNHVNVFTMNANGSDVLRLTDTGLAYNHSPAWSPDGTSILFVSRRDGDDDDIYIMNTDGGSQSPLTANGATDTSPGWSPDGLHIIFQSNQDGNDEIYVMDANGSNIQRITNNAANDVSPAWRLMPHIQVNTTSMVVADDGLCSLIEAITAANTDTPSGAAAGECVPSSGDDAIWLQAGQTYTLTTINNNTDGDNGLPSLTTTVTINGNGATITREGAAPAFRIFHLAASGNLTLNDMTVSNGTAANAGIPSGTQGGAIYNLGVLTIQNVLIENNQAQNGAGLSNLSGASMTVPTVYRHTVA